MKFQINNPVPTEGSTHYVGCYEAHHSCAVAKIHYIHHELLNIQKIWKNKALTDNQAIDQTFNTIEWLIEEIDSINVQKDRTNNE